MKTIPFLFLCISLSLFSQENIETSLIKKTVLKADQIVGVDNFETQYYIHKNTLFKSNSTSTLSYSNVQLGAISSANAFNPLKINLFFKDFNTIIILDNRLAEVYKIDFNTKQPYKNVSHISTGYDNSIWVFNTDSQQLELYDYKTNKVRATTLPVVSDVLDLKSNYNYCWLLTENYLYTYNYFGSLISKLENKGFTAIQQDNGNLVIKGKDRLLYLKKNETEVKDISLPKLLINQFLLTNERLYIYDNETLQQFQLKIE